MAALCGGMFGLCLSKVGESQRRSNRIIELQEAILANPDDNDSRELLESYDSRRPYSMHTVVLFFAAGSAFLVGCQYFGAKYKSN